MCRACVQDGDTFKVALFYRPYIYVGVSEDRFIPEVTQLLQRKFDQVGASIVSMSNVRGA